MRTNRRAHLTGQVWRRGTSELERGLATIIASCCSDLAKLNPKYHMNYSNIFTESSFIHKLHIELNSHSDVTVSYLQ